MAPQIPVDKKQKELPRAKNAPLMLKIGEQWYDLTNWQSCHPGGGEILRHLHGDDATGMFCIFVFVWTNFFCLQQIFPSVPESSRQVSLFTCPNPPPPPLLPPSLAPSPCSDAFFSLHSQEAIARLAKIPKAKQAPGPEPEVSELAKNFRKFRAELEKEGYFKRNPLWDAFYVGIVLVFCAIGTMIANEHPWIATLLIGVAMQQAGWLGHDYVHGRGTGSWWLGRLLGGGINGFSSWWWSDKHNTHHVYPNTVGIDRDIAMDPIFYLFHPDPEKDVATRKYQHLYFIPVCAGLYASWRIQGVQYSWANKLYFELFLQAINYTWLLFFLPLPVSIGSILLGGWLVGIVVTASHQSEDMLEIGHKYDYVLDQFLSTRDASSSNPIMNYLWGGMQYQLEHHLFPTMPKYYFPEILPRVVKFAKDNNVEYRTEGVWEIWARNLRTIKNFAETPVKAE
jgi:fatty acid desaturase